MSDYRDLLERLADRADLPAAAFERLTKRRDRRRRTTRITAGVVALLVATAGTLTAIRVVGSTTPQPGVAPADGFFALWPETSYQDALDAHERFVEGEHQWRRHGELTALEFAKRVLFWPDARVECSEIETAHSGVFCSYGAPLTSMNLVVYRQGTTDPLPPPLRVRVERLLGGELDGIWSVTLVEGSDVRLPLRPGDAVEVPTTYAIPLAPDARMDGWNGMAGWHWMWHAGREDCAESVGEGMIQPQGNVLRVRVVDVGCLNASGEGQGWLAVYRVSGEQDGLSLSFTRPRGPIDDLAVVPVRFVQRTAQSLAPSGEEDDATSPRFGYGRIPLGEGAGCPRGPFAAATSSEIELFGEILLDGATDEKPRTLNARIVWDLVDPVTQALFGTYEDFESEFMSILDGYPGGVVVGTGAVPPYHVVPQIVDRCGQAVAEFVFTVELYWADGHSVALIRLVGRPDGLRLWFVE